MTVVFSKPPPRRKILVVADIHWVNRDPAAFALMEAFRHWWRPDTLINLGDVADWPRFSRFANGTYDEARNPKALADEITMEEVKGIQRWHDTLHREHPKSELVFVAGNHDAFVERELLTTGTPLIGLTGIFNLPSLYRLPPNGIRFIPYRRWWDAYGLRWTHGVRSGAAAELKAHSYRAGWSGHIHRPQIAREQIGDAAQEWWSAACLCKLDLEWAYGNKWSHGIGVAEWDADRQTLHREMVPISDNRLCWREFNAEWTADPAPPALGGPDAA